VRRFWKRDEDAVDRVLRSARPEARDELVAELADRVTAVGPVPRWSRVAFAGAMTVFMLGFFASFGGLGYAASNAQSAAKSVTRIVTTVKTQKLVVQKRSAAQDQYGHQTYTPPVAKPIKRVIKVAGISTSKPAASSGELPFTGLGLGITAALGLMLLGVGALLRRRESRAR
jgi:hypothetical protein